MCRREPREFKGGDRHADFGSTTSTRRGPRTALAWGVWQAYPDACYWFESHPVRNWTWSNNLVRNANYGPGKGPGDLFLSACLPSQPDVT
jgi:hypothetical protein